VFVNDSCQCPQGLVDVARILKLLRDIGLEHYDRAACGITRSIFVWPSVTEIVLRKDFVAFDPACLSFSIFSLDNLSAPRRRPPRAYDANSFAAVDKQEDVSFLIR
jgi:hypothetical protein